MKGKRLPSRLLGKRRTGKQGAVFLSYSFTIAVLIVLAIVYRIPASTDDFHWGCLLKEGGTLPLIDDYFFRLPVCKVLYNLTLPILLGHPFWGKFMIWGIGVVGILLPLSWFFQRFRFDPRALPAISFLVFFAPNQYELNFNLSSMPFTFGLLFVGLGFLCFRRAWKAAGLVFYLLAFLTLESYIALALLLEFSARVPSLADRKVFKKIVLELLPLMIVFGAVRGGLHLVHPFHYGAAVSLRFSQWKGFIIKSFLIDCFKLNSILSTIQLLIYGTLAYVLLKGLSPEERRRWAGSLLILFILLTVLSGYYYALDYPAGRALIGQIAFVWAAYLLFGFGFLSRLRGRFPARFLLFAVLISMQVANQTLIFRTKRFNSAQIEKEIVSVRDRLSRSAGTIDVDPHQIRGHFRRDWIFGSNADVEAMLKYYLTPQQFSRLRVLK